MSVAPEVSTEATRGRTSRSTKRLEKHPEVKEARLDNGLDESMDAAIRPRRPSRCTVSEPPASSGYDAEAERKLRDQELNRRFVRRGTVVTRPPLVA